ncbi:hypothetical protein GW17_00046654 [Ensete ventricosum]|nr:hypothetical protein GW17_00046654 [Ensete ventricosum]
MQGGSRSLSTLPKKVNKRWSLFPRLIVVKLGDARWVLHTDQSQKFLDLTHPKIKLERSGGEERESLAYASQVDNFYTYERRLVVHDSLMVYDPSVASSYISYGLRPICSGRCHAASFQSLRSDPVPRDAVPCFTE